MARGVSFPVTSTAVHYAVIVPPCSCTRVVDDALSQNAKRFIEEVPGDEPESAKTLRIEARELRAGELN